MVDILTPSEKPGNLDPDGCTNILAPRHQQSHRSQVTGHGPDLRLRVAFHDSLGHRVNIDLDCGRITDPDVVLGSSLGLVVPIPGGSKGHPDQ